MATYWENSCSFGLRYVSWYKYLTVSLVFSHLGFWSGNLFLIAPFPDLCLLVPFHMTLAVGGTLNPNQTTKPTRKHTPLPDQITITPICIPTYANILQILPYHATANILCKYICMQSAHTLANMTIIFIFDTCKRGLIFATCLHMFER